MLYIINEVRADPSSASHLPNDSSRLEPTAGTQKTPVRGRGRGRGRPRTRNSYTGAPTRPVPYK